MRSTWHPFCPQTWHPQRSWLLLCRASGYARQTSWVGAYVTYGSTPPITSALLPDHTGQKQQEQKGRHFPIPSLRVINRKNTKAGGPAGPPHYSPDNLNPVPMKCLANELPCSRPHHKQKQQNHKRRHGCCSAVRVSAVKPVQPGRGVRDALEMLALALLLRRQQAEENC